ncbi:MAG: hypothetical protein HYY81_06725 [Deltaproteobacteria bacterium]|nr:hypothetical protein [Deltaproteobacteria bacterium]
MSRPIPPKEGEEAIWSGSEDHYPKKDFRIGVDPDRISVCDYVSYPFPHRGETMECEGEWWPGNGHAGDIKDGNDGTLQNGATFAPGMVGQARLGNYFPLFM